jgi:hypothetical protein
MSNFLTGKDLNDSIYDIIWNATKNLVIVSPFIKLDHYFKEIFSHHKHNHKLHITIVFGKNEAEPKKSLRAEDFDFFKQFKNISIVYCPKLHAKYYANESNGVLTSINLYDASFVDNIEYGVLYSPGILNSLANGADKAAWSYSFEIANKNPIIFVKRPVYDKSILGSLIGQKNYIDSETLHDQTEIILNHWNHWGKEQKKFLNEFPEELQGKDKDSKRPDRHDTVRPPAPEPVSGFCIRTGVHIPFNPLKPMSAEAYKSWAQYSNPDYKEKYCHKTGEKSSGKTSMRKPIL